jgi:hypothetical protein
MSGKEFEKILRTIRNSESETRDRQVHVQRETRDQGAKEKAPDWHERPNRWSGGGRER